MAVDSKEVFTQLRKILDFPKYTVRCVITLDAGEAAQVECTYWASWAPDAEPITKRYTLTEIEPT